MTRRQIDQQRADHLWDQIDALIEERSNLRSDLDLVQGVVEKAVVRSEIARVNRLLAALTADLPEQDVVDLVPVSL